MRALRRRAIGRDPSTPGNHVPPQVQKEEDTHRLKTLAARDDLMNLTELVQSGRRTCLLCLEASPEHCHRSMVPGALGDLIPIKLNHLSAIPPA